MRAKPTPEQALNFLPARLGGTGAGFTKGRDKRASTVYLGATKHGNSLSATPYLSRMSDDTPQRSTALLATVTPEVLEARARAVSLGLLDRLDSVRDSMDVSEMVDTLKEAGKLSGVQRNVQVQHRHELIPAEQRAERASQLLAKARHLLSNSSADSTPDDTAPPTVDAQVIDVQGDSTDAQGTDDPSA